jgi:hypothetical protein
MVDFSQKRGFQLRPGLKIRFFDVHSNSIFFFWKFNAEKLFDHQTTSKPVETGFLPKLNLKGREDVKNSRHSVVSYTTFSGVILTSNIHTKNIRLNSRCNKEGVRRKNSSKIVKSQSKFPIRIIF